MKTISVLRQISWMALLLILMSVPPACKKITNPLENLKLIIDYNLIKTTIDFHIKDAATGEFLGSDASRDAIIIISGKDAQGVLDPVGGRLKDNTVKVNRGMAAIGISPAPAYTPSADKPVQFSIVVMAPGYLTMTRQISITQTGRHFVEVTMVKLNNTPNGVTATQQSGAANVQNGTVTASSTVTLPQVNTNLSIPQGLVMKDANGNPLQGDINVTMVHFDPTEAQALNSFPGGLMPTVKRSNGQVQQGMFYTASFVAIEIIDQYGRVAATFENGTLLLTTPVNSQVFNPEVNGAVAPGQTVGIWSLNENTGQWQEEGSTTIFSQDGMLKVSANLTHLSYYAFNWFTGNICEQGSPFVFNISPAMQGSFLIGAKIFRQADNVMLTRAMVWVSNGQPVFMTNMPRNTPVRIEWDTENSPFLSVDPGSQNLLLNEICGSSPVQVNLIANSSGQFTTITFQASVYCADKPEVVIYPSFTAYCQAVTGGPVIPIEMVQGQAVVSGIVLGQEYNIWVIYDGKEYSTVATATQNSYSWLDFEIPANVCEEVFGGGN
ncbi:MAG: hypothetical protein IPM52_08170 [Bacteroidetes bacterium]|nr:hypothetical protein [Bacteroidota bacterium]